jgi:xylulokinase
LPDIADIAVIGADLGTGSLKTLLVTLNGSVVAEASQEYRMHHARPGWSENDPADWVAAFRACVQQLALVARQRRLRVPAVCLVAQRDPVVLLDADGRPVTSSISWTDQRSGAYAEHLRKAIGFERLIEIGGARPITGLGLPNLLWTRDNLPDAWAATASVTSPKGYVLRTVAGITSTDITTPTRSLAYDTGRFSWSTEILNAVDISVSIFDDVRYAPWEPCREVDPDWAVPLGLGRGVVLAAGGSDDEAAALGAGAVAPGQVCVSTGTCTEWFAVLRAYQPDLAGLGDVAPHVIPERFVREVAIDSAGASMRWFRDELCRDLAPSVSYGDIVTLAMQAPPGADGLRFYPFIGGAERAPYYQDNASGVFFGITSHHTRAHLARAILEGIAFLYPRTRDLLGASTSPGPLTLMDGEANSPEWNQLKADVLGEPLRVTKVPDSSALGAAILAAVSAELSPTIGEAVAAMVHYGPVTEPRLPEHERYLDLRAEFERTFEQLRGCFRPHDEQLPT